MNPGEPEVLQAPAAKELAQPEPEPFFRDIFEALAMAIIFSLCVKQFALEAYKVPTGSMEPTIHGDPKVGDRILVNKLAYTFRDPRRWEIAVFQFPNNRKINYIKRIVGVGGEHGETIAIRGGDIYTMPFDVERIDKYLELYKSGVMTIQRKPQKVQDAIFARYPQIEEPETTFGDEETFVRHWVLPREEIEPRATWSFDGGMVVRAPGSESLVNYRRRITDSRLGITRQEDFSAVGKDPVGDIKVELTVEPIEAGGELVIDLRDPAHSLPLRLCVPVAQGSEAETSPLRILVNRKVIAEDRDVELPVGESTRIAMSNVDDRIQVHVNDILIMSAEYEHEPVYRDSMSAAQRTSFGAKNAAIRIARAQIYRDLYHQSYRSCRIPPGHYYMLGDNSRASKDSREWQRITIHPEARNGEAVYGDREAVENPNDLEQRMNNPFVRGERTFFVDEFGNLLELTGKNFVPMHNENSPLVPRRLLTGRAFAVFWPWDRMQVVR